ncbi:MAG: Coenzyme F420 hydrogenase/dehydrogenase, beta subunit C-terminal domain [Clostridia bacterium]|nr:Coenzyme F420 hydrogenase/dehydrogenase, beta subunit C-terminal domain [Clostridia bacterium]
MLKVIDKSLCNGCTACKQVCPKNCITFERDENGFLYPVIDSERCINCNLCKKTCPVLNKGENAEKQVNAFAVINKNDSERQDSSSGGVFSLLAKYVLSKNGVVFGASFDENFVVKHLYIEKESDLYKLRKSKYVQSEINDTFLKTKDFLEQGRLVLFTGTPCQIGGLLSYLKKPYDNLITQDVICHGVPSPKVWQKYLETKLNNGKIYNISFRDKRLSWKNYLFTIEYQDKIESESLSENPYMQLFLKNVILRESCYNCAFKDKFRNSDITLADFWGIDNVCKDFNDDKGVSLVIVNSNKGENLFNDIKSDLIYNQTDFEKAISYNPAMTNSVKINKNRQKFFNKLDKVDFKKLSIKYTKQSKFTIFINIFKSLIKRILKKLKGER